MEKIKAIYRELVQKPLYTFIAGLVIGLIIGLPVLGWGLMPVKWKDADPSYLRDDLKKQYLCMIVDSFKVNKDADLAAARLTELGADIKNPQLLFADLQAGGCSYNSSDKVVMNLQTALLNMSGGAGVVAEPSKNTETTTVPLPQETAPKPKSKGGTVLLVLLLAFLLAIAGALVYIFFIRNRRTSDAIPAPVDEEGEYIEEDESLFEPEPTEELPVESVEPSLYPVTVAPPVTNEPEQVKLAQPAVTFGGEPVAHFMTTYVIGDDLYDDSFSIDAPNGAFLGECGVGISDTIGVGDPKKVTAFEVWLFDKNDIQTVTKVLMSSHAMNDAAIRQRLASKGEPVLLEPEQQILLETATLQLEARIIEMVYGQGALPSGSFIERLTLELSVWPK